MNLDAFMNDKIYIVMAVYAPNAEYLRAQIQSIATQSYKRFHVVFVIADLSSMSLVKDYADEAKLEYTIHEPLAERDAVRAFEEGLQVAYDMSMADEGEIFFALSDQDDVWYPNKLEKLHAEFADSQVTLVHSDARLVDGQGAEIFASMFRYERRVKDPGMRGLLYVNNITGMTAMLRRSVLDVALPFPPQSGVYFYHDLWLGLVSSSLGRIRLIREPLVDYRQHGNNAVGAVDRVTTKFKSLLPSRAMLRRGAGAYAIARYLAHVLDIRLQEKREASHSHIAEDATKPIQAFLRPRGFGGRFFADAITNFARGKLNASRIALGYGVISWARQIWTFRRVLKEDIDETYTAFDKRLYSLAPGFPPSTPKKIQTLESNKFLDVIDDRKRPRFVPNFVAEQPAINLLVPSLNQADAFAGIATALDIALGLAKSGHNVRFIATDLVVASKISSLGFLRRRSGAKDAKDALWNRIHLHCGVSDGEIPMHKNDIFMATAWWTAHAAQNLISSYPFLQEKFIYLIQDFEPNFYPWGGEFSDAMASYEMNFTPLFNTSLLREYFVEQGFEFANDARFAFRPSIDVSRYSSGTRVAIKGRKPRIAVYGRPEVARNMFSSSIEAIAQFVEREKLTPDEIEILSVGLTHDPITLPTGHVVESLGKLPWEDYPDFLLGVDVGLSLMYSPHPSHPPIEMAASGARVVTNNFGPKNLSQLSSAIISVEPNVAALGQAMSDAWHAKEVAQSEREIDLSPLGEELGDMVAELSQALQVQFAQKKTLKNVA